MPSPPIAMPRFSQPDMPETVLSGSIPTPENGVERPIMESFRGGQANTMTGRRLISGVLKEYTLAFSILAAAAGYGVILFVPGMAGVYVASALCGVSLSCFMAMTSYLISVSVEKEAVAKASGMFSIIGGIGGLVAPIVLGNVATYVLGGNHPVNQFTIAFVGMLMFGIVVTISGRKMKEKNQ